MAREEVPFRRGRSDGVGMEPSLAGVWLSTSSVPWLAQEPLHLAVLTVSTPSIEHLPNIRSVFGRVPSPPPLSRPQGGVLGHGKKVNGLAQRQLS